MRSFSIAGIQMNVSAAHSNLEMMKFKLDVLMSIYPWVQMVVFSELCAHGPLTHFAREFPNSDLEEFQNMAAKYGIWLLPGSMFEKEGNDVYNTAVVINPSGHLVGKYRKMFPFFPYEEGVKPGEEFFIFDVPEVARFGVSICYDMWFPETSRTLATKGAEVILHPTLTGTMDRDIELAIARSTAAINQCYFFDVNGLGAGGNGKSIVCGPDGRVLYQAGQIEEFIPMELDIDAVKRSRERGVLRLGQPLKSFRDHLAEFTIYQKGVRHPYLDSLGPLIKPSKIKKKEGDLKVISQPPSSPPNVQPDDLNEKY
ncbi:carbon-nitrogen hydrolase family protein [bacterium]|nr:carbon-nitrogen hydrolase family protein [bacterium]